METTETTKTCRFIRAWIGQCNEPVEDGDFCEEHTKSKCYKCSSQATRDCAHTSFLVCGFPMCAKHRHHSDG